MLQFRVTSAGTQITHCNIETPCRESGPQLLAHGIVVPQYQERLGVRRVAWSNGGERDLCLHHRPLLLVRHTTSNGRLRGERLGSRSSWLLVFERYATDPFKLNGCAQMRNERSTANG